MSNLANEGLDPNVEEVTGDYNVIPAGEYKAVLIADQIKPTNNKKGKKLEIKNQIIEGEYKGQTVPDRFNIKNESIACQKMGQGKVRRLCNLVNLPYPPDDTSYGYGKPYMITVTVDQYIDKNGEEKPCNKITAYNPVKNSNSVEESSEAEVPLNSGEPW